MLRRIVGEGPHREMWRWLRSQMSQYQIQCKPASPDPDVVRHQPEANRWFKNCGVDLMIYPESTRLSFEAGVPYIMAIHDLQHRLQPEFPEVSADGEWERREYRFRNGARCAMLLLADSEVRQGTSSIFTDPMVSRLTRSRFCPFSRPAISLQIFHELSESACERSTVCRSVICSIRRNFGHTKTMLASFKPWVC